MEPGTKVLSPELCCEIAARRYETAHVADSQRSLDPLFKNKRSRTIAKGGGLRSVCKPARSDLEPGEPLCEILLTSTHGIVARSFERLAKD
jgi:hypothetical protein